MYFIDMSNIKLWIDFSTQCTTKMENVQIIREIMRVYDLFGEKVDFTEYLSQIMRVKLRHFHTVG